MAMTRTKTALKKSKPTPPADWTVMIYLAGDNNLTEEMVWALKEIMAWARMGVIKEEVEKVVGNLGPNPSPNNVIQAWQQAPNASKFEGVKDVDVKAALSSIDSHIPPVRGRAPRPAQPGQPSRPAIDIKVVAQFDPSGMGIPTQRYDFGKAPKKIGSRDGDLYNWRVTKIGVNKFVPTDENTGNPEALKDFIVWAANEYPANHYAVILSGHGSGATEDFLMKDENPVDSLSIPELQEALQEAVNDMKKSKKILGCRKGIANNVKIEILGMDCCFMSMAEVAHSLKGYVDILIGAEGLEPESGWPYHRFLEAIKQNPSLYKGSSVEIAKMIVDKYVEYYSDYDRTAGRSVDLAAIDLRKMLIVSPIRDLASSLIAVMNNRQLKRREQVILAHWEAQTYKYDQYTDLKDFCIRLKKRFPTRGIYTDSSPKASAIRKACKRVIDAVDACRLRSGCAGFAYQHSHGLSIYFPWAEVAGAYKSLDLSKNTKSDPSRWFEFLEHYVVETRRRARAGFDSNFVAQTLSNTEEDQWNDAIKIIFDRLKTKVTRKDVIKAARSLMGPFRVVGFPGDSGGHRYLRSRYLRSRYLRSRYAEDRSIWVKNPPFGSGKVFEP
jgi:hypothetical protein